MAYILLKKFHKVKWGPDERKLSLHVIDNDLATEIAQELNKSMDELKAKAKNVPHFELNRRGQYAAKMDKEFNKFWTEDFFLRCFTVMLKFGFRLDKQYDEADGAITKEIFVFLKTTEKR